MRRRLLALLATMAVATVPALAETQVNRTARLARSAESELTVLCPAGDLRISPSPDDQVRVRAVLYDDTLRLAVSSAPGRRSVLVDLKGHSRALPLAALIEIEVPVWASIRVQGAEVDVTIRADNPRQVVEVASREGDVRVQGTAAVVNAGTFSGVLALDGDWGELTARTATGNITLRGTAATASVSTLSGATDAELTGLAHATFDSVSGSQTLHVAFRDPEAANSLRVETGSGDIRLWVPPELEPTYQITTDYGHGTLSETPRLEVGDEVRGVDFGNMVSATMGISDSGAFTAFSATVVSQDPAAVARGYIILNTRRGTLALHTWRPE